MIESFVNYYNCGGYASSMNGRDPEHPHMLWCAQYHEWEAWKAAKWSTALGAKEKLVDKEQDTGYYY